MKDRKIFSNASWIMIGRIFQLVLTFATTMLVTRYLGPGEYGKITYVYSYIQLFLPICVLGMNDIAVKELVDDRDRNDEILGTMIVLRLLVSLLSMACSIFVVTLFNDGRVYRDLAFLLSFSLMFQSFDGIMYFYQSKLLSRKTGTVFVFAYLLSSVYRIFGILNKKDIYWFAFAMSFDFLMVAALLLFVYLKDRNRFRFSLPMAGKLLKKSSYYIFSGLLVVIYGKVTDTLLLGKMVSETSVGYYSAGTTLCNAWPFVLTAIIDSLSPVIIDARKTDPKAYYRRLRQLYALIFYISAFVAVGITLFSEFAIMILYGEEFAPAALPMKIYAWSTAFSYLGVARSIWMQCENRTRFEVVISLFGAVTNIALNYILIAKHGIIGAACAAVLTQFLTNFVFLFTMKDTRENAKLILDSILLKDISYREGSR